MTGPEVETALKADGWQLTAHEGSHRQYIHTTKPGRVTLSYHRRSDIMHPKTLATIARQAGLTVEALAELA